jgi:hypothetical protein
LYFVLVHFPFLLPEEEFSISSRGIYSAVLPATTTTAPVPVSTESPLNSATKPVAPLQNDTLSIPRPSEGYDYSKEYTHIDTCFEPLPEAWLAMQEKGSKGRASIREVQERLLNICKKTVEKVKQGETIKPMPIFEPEQKPHVVEAAPAPVEPQPDYSVLSGAYHYSAVSALLGLLFLIL